MNTFFGYDRSTVFCLTMLLTLAITPCGGHALAIDAHPPQLVGRWVTEISPSVTIVFQEEGSLKRLRGDEPVADYGYWEQPADGKLRIKWFKQEPRLVSYKIDGDVLRLTTDEGDTLAHRRVRSEKPIEIVGDWVIEKANPGTRDPSLILHADGTYEVDAVMWRSRLGPTSTFPDTGRGAWKWLENDWIEFTSPSIKAESRWHVRLNDGELKFVSPHGEIVVFTKPEVFPTERKSPPTAAEKPVSPQRPGDDWAEVAALRKVRAQALEKETLARIEEAKSRISSDPQGACDILQVCKDLVIKSDDLDGATRDRLCRQLNSWTGKALEEWVKDQRR